jgi:hypothetical protein
MIPTLLIANIIEQSNKLNPLVPDEKAILDELERVQFLLIDSANNQLREFAGMISREFFFTENSGLGSHGVDKKPNRGGMKIM